jgi:hypothetical protein
VSHATVNDKPPYPSGVIGWFIVDAEDGYGEDSRENAWRKLVAQFPSSRVRMMQFEFVGEVDRAVSFNEYLQRFGLSQIDVVPTSEEITCATMRSFTGMDADACRTKIKELNGWLQRWQTYLKEGE